MCCRLLLPLLLPCLTLSVAHATDTYFESNGVKIHYVTAGEGEPVVLIHGWLGDSTMWGRDSLGNTKLTPAAGFRAIAFDCRGHGKSDKPHEQDKYGTEMAEDVIRLLDHLKIKRAHLIGYSMGAFIAGNVAAKHPERVLSVVYGGQAPLIKGAPDSGSREVDVFAKAVEEGKGLGSYLLYVLPADKPKMTLEQANALTRYLYGAKDIKALALAGQSLAALAVPAEELGRGKVPVLFIYGENESAHTKDSVAAAQKLLVMSQVKVIKGSDHVTTLAKPEFGAAIMDFLLSVKSK